VGSVDIWGQLQTLLILVCGVKNKLLGLLVKRCYARLNLDIGRVSAKGYSVVRTLSTDQRSAREEHSPRRRRNTRRKGAENETHNAAEVDTELDIAPENHVSQDFVLAHVSEDGSGQAPKLPPVDDDSGAQYSAMNSAKHRRTTRRPGRRKQVVDVPAPQLKQTAPESSKPKRPVKRNSSSLYAALDLGTNNCRLLIATPQKKGRFRVVDGFSRIVRLGEGLAQTGNLSEGAMDRAIDALAVCAAKLKDRGIREQRLIATEACRQAGNGEQFLSRVTQETGLQLEIVSREAEARLAAQGCGSLIDRKAKGAVLFDIGGGSSELILVHCKNQDHSDISNRMLGWTSLPMGVVTLAEQFGGQDVSRELFEEMEQCVLDEIEKFEERNAFGESFSKENFHLLGTSGTVTTLAGIHLKLPKYDRRRVDGLWLNSKDVDVVIEQLLVMSYEARMQNPCVGKERADLVLAGCAILNAIRKTWPTNRLRVADRGLREGLLSQMMSQDDKWQSVNSGNHNKKRRRPPRGRKNKGANA